MSDVNGGGASASWGSRARCRPRRSPAREEECPWHRTIRKIPRRALAPGNHICSPCAKCQPRYLNHPVKSSQQVWVYHPHFVDKKMEAHGKSCPKSPNPRAGTGATPAPSALCRLRPAIIPLSPKARRFFISWRPQEPVLFCLVGDKSRSRELILQWTRRALHLLLAVRPGSGAADPARTVRGVLSPL